MLVLIVFLLDSIVKHILLASLPKVRTRLYYFQMAKLTPQDVLKLAKLARIQITEEELQKYSDELSAILEYVEQLSQVDTKGLKPTYQVTGLTDVMRPDELVDYGTTTAELLKNVPQTEKSYIKVKRMIG